MFLLIHYYRFYTYCLRFYQEIMLWNAFISEAVRTVMIGSFCKWHEAFF